MIRKKKKNQNDLHIIKYLEENYGNKWCWAGVLARAIHDLTGTKESVVERKARYLVREGILEKELAQVEGKGPMCVKYKILPPVALTEEVMFNQTELI